MILDVDIMQRCEDLLESVGDKEIARYCYENDLMTKEQALKIVDDEEDLERHKHFCSIFVNPNDVLNEIDNDDLYELLKDDDYDFPKEEDDEDKYEPWLTKEEWIRDIRNYFSQNFTKVFTKEDFKRELCKAIDDYTYGI